MWKVGAIIVIVLLVDLCIIGICKALRRTTEECDKKDEKVDC
jgi:hypothetical protein